MAKRPKVPITEMKIHTFTPTDPGQRSIALIGNLPMMFRGGTPKAAKAKEAAAAKEARAAALQTKRQQKEKANA